jgi:hypothetical protein
MLHEMFSMVDTVRSRRIVSIGAKLHGILAGTLRQESSKSAFQYPASHPNSGSLIALRDT